MLERTTALASESRELAQVARVGLLRKRRQPFFNLQIVRKGAHHGRIGISQRHPRSVCARTLACANNEAGTRALLYASSAFSNCSACSAPPGSSSCLK